MDNIVPIHNRLEDGTHTLVHGDFSPRNLCFLGEASGFKTLLFDWGMVAVDVPQFDLHYFINYMVDSANTPDLPDHLIDTYLDALPNPVRDTVDREAFMHIYNLSAFRYLGTRELLACTFANAEWAFRTLKRNLHWAERVIDTCL